MSRLDEIINSAKGIKLTNGEGWEGFTYLTDLKHDKQQIKELFLELIGPDVPTFKYIDGLVDDKKRKAVNKYIAQLRQKVEQL